jgi:hypothetical protein
MASSNSVTCSGVTDTSRAGDVVLELGDLACTDDGDTGTGRCRSQASAKLCGADYSKTITIEPGQAQQDFPELTREDINARFAFAEGRI